MEKTLKIGIIGCGGIANGKHMPSLAKVKGVEMVAFCDIIPEKAEKAAKKFGTADAKTYTDYKELLADKTIDVVHVCTPNRSHSYITVDALEAGTLEEGWGCGTAAVVSPIGQLYYNGKTYTINNGKIGETTQKLYDTLTGIQWGKIADTRGWVHPIK
jgi:threonine dehydrogenase-like Zn-dependent dehydrogenase